MTPYALYTDGTGKLHRVLDTIEWIDDSEDAGNGLVFRKLSNVIPEQE